MYLLTQTRPDIGFTMQWLFRFLQKPLQTHLNASKNLFKFTGGTEDLSICYGCEGLTSGLQPIEYCDSDFGGDRESSKSTYGYVFKFAGGPISWKLKRASTIALSTLEVEIDALTEGIREVSWIVGLFRELERPISRPIVLYSDSTNVITTVYDPVFHSRTKHILLKYHYVRKQVKQRLIEVTYLDIKCMPADGLTKPLNSHLYPKFLGLLGLESKPNLTIEGTRPTG